jgi:hypothetical protein
LICSAECDVHELFVVESDTMHESDISQRVLMDDLGLTGKQASLFKDMIS